MSRRRYAAVSPIAIFVAAVIVGAIVLAVLGTAIFQTASKRVKDRADERQSMQDFLGEAKKLADGGSMGKMPDFPDTPLGRMQRVVFLWAKEGQDRSAQMMKTLEGLDWQWVGSPDSLKTKANLEKCLATTPKAKKEVEKLLAWIDVGYAKALADMEAQADGSKDAGSFLSGLKLANQSQVSGFQLGKKTWQLLIKNIESLEEMFRFLLARTGKYSVTEDGLIDFKSGVTDKEQAEYEAIVDRVNGYLEEIAQLEEKRRKVAMEHFDRATKELSR